MKNPFKQYQNIHIGEEAILFGSGPSITKIDFDKIKDKILKIGLNNQIFIKNINLDYWFQGDALWQDLTRFYDNFHKYNDYLPKKQKFVRFCMWGNERETFYYKGIPVKKNGQTPLGMKNTIYYPAFLPDNDKSICSFNKDFGHDFAIQAKGSITFEALQFIIYCGIKKIYLIGHDCDYSNGTFDGCIVGKQQNAGHHIRKYWKAVLLWLQINKPEVSIIWVHPTEQMKTIIKECDNIQIALEKNLMEKIYD